MSEKNQILEVISLEDWESINHANGEQSPIYRFINNSESRNRIANWEKDQAKKANTSKIAFQLIKDVKNKDRTYDTHLVLQALSEGLSGEFEFDLEDSLITSSDFTSQPIGWYYIGPLSKDHE